MKLIAFVLALLAAPAFAQTAPPAPDPFASLHFLIGSWEAIGSGPGGVHTTGKYAFRPDLKNKILSRTGEQDKGCTGPVTFDCDHGDMLYVYPEAGALRAIYFDNEGHVIHYAVTTPTPTSVIFLSDSSQPGPQFRLSYELKAGVMTGKFQMHMPGQDLWTTYLDWTGAKH